MLDKTTSAVTESSIRNIGRILIDVTQPLKARFRALFTLRNIGGPAAINCIAACFADSSALLKHECAYCLGQMQDERVLGVLSSVLKDQQQEAIVRHEAGEALGAIGSLTSLDVLQEYCDDDSTAVAETCRLAVDRIKWVHNEGAASETLSLNPYSSVDPAPPAIEQNVRSLKITLLDEALPLFERYRAMFALRNLGCEDAILALAEGLERAGSALFRHEVAYILGQTQHTSAVCQLDRSLRKTTESAMVRHECAEALGAIATQACTHALGEFLRDDERLVRESCEVALDMCDYESSGQFQYADGLDTVTHPGDTVTQAGDTVAQAGNTVTQSVSVTDSAS